MPKYSAEANNLWPYLHKRIERMVAGGGGVRVIGGTSTEPPLGDYAPAPHFLDSAYHEGTLSAAQGPLFLLVDGSRDLTGNLDVNDGILLDGVDLSIFKAAYDAHLTPDYHHNRATAGDGLLIDYTLQELSVNQDFDFLWTGTHTFTSDIQLSANLDFIGGDRVITASSDLTLTPVDDLILTSTKTFRSSDYADGIPIFGFSMFPVEGGSINRQLTINSIKTDEFHTRLFVADTVRIDIGEEYWGKSMGIVYADFTTPGAIGGTVSAVFEDSPLMPAEIFASGDWLLIRYLDNAIGFGFGSVWGQVSAYVDLGLDATGRGRQQWTFTLRAGPVGQVIKAGNIAVDLGVSGQGFVHLSTLDSAQGPWIRIGEWTGSTPYAPPGENIGVTGTQIGLLNNISDSDLNPAGYGLYSDNAYLRGAVRTAETMMDDDGLAFSLVNASSLAAFLGSRLTWWPDLDDRSGYSAAQLTVWQDATAPGEGTYLVLEADARATATTAEVTVQALGEVYAAGAVFRGDGTATVIGVNGIGVWGTLRPTDDLTYDLGTASYRWRAIYVDELHANTITGEVMGGSEWEFAGNMIIDANSAGLTQVSVVNQGAGSVTLAVDGSITVTGTVDGVDISSHAAASTHHNPASALASGGITVTGAGQVISIDLATNSGLELTAGGLKVAAVLAGVGLSYDSGTGTITVDPLLAGNGLMMTTGVLRVGTGDGITVSADAVAVATTLAGDGLLFSAAGVLAVNPGAGLEIAGDTVAINLATTSGLNTTSGLAVGAGSGISVLTNTIAVDRGTDSGLTFTDGLVVNPTIAGDGLQMVSGIIDVIPANASITVGTNSLNVNLAHTWAWTGSHTWSTGVFTFNTDLQVNANLDFVGERVITSSATNALTMQPGGDLVLDPGGDDVLPGGSVEVDLGDYNRKWRTLFAAELYVENLVASNVMATIGGRIMVTPTTKLINDVTVGAVVIDVKDNIFTAGDYVLLQTAPGGVAQFEVMRIVNTIGAITGGYRYNVTGFRNQDGTGANAWLAGDAVVDFASEVGEGWIDLTSVNTAVNHLGPTVTVYARWSDSAWNAVTPVVTMGNLDSFVGYGTEYGFATGNDLTLTPATGFSGVTVDRTAGMKLYNTDILLYEDSELQVMLDTESGLSLQTGGGEMNRISWVDDLTNPFPATLAFISHTTTSGFWDLLTLKSQGNTEKGTIQLAATSFTSQRTLWIDSEEGLIFGSGPSSPPAAQFVIDSAGNVGIGTDAPLNNLHVVEGTLNAEAFRLVVNAIDTAVPHGIIFINTDTSADSAHGIRFDVAADTGAINRQAAIFAGKEQLYIHASGPTKDGYLAFMTAEDGVLGEAMRISAAGNVGIGVTPSLGKLHVSQTTLNGNALTLEMNTTSATTPAGLVLINRDTGAASATGIRLDMVQDTGGITRGAAIYAIKEQFFTATTSTRDASLVFMTVLNNTLGEVMRLTSANFVGVGTTAPLSRFHISDNNALTDHTKGLIIEQAGVGDATLQFYLTGVRRYTMGIDNSDSDKLKISTNADVGATPLFQMTTTGDVTLAGSLSTPSAAVTGAMSVGTVNATDVNVTGMLTMANFDAAFGTIEDVTINGVVYGTPTFPNNVNFSSQVTISSVLTAYSGSATESVLIYQDSTTAAKPALRLRQLDLSEELIEFTGTVATGNPIEADTTPAAVTTHKVRVSVNGTPGYMYIYAS